MELRFATQSATKAAIIFVRWVRTLWPVAFLVPLGVFAGRYCNLSVTDPFYHALLWAHERLPEIVLGLAALSLARLAVSVAISESSLNVLLRFASDAPENIRSEFENLQAQTGSAATLVYLNLPQRVAFPHWRANAVVVSAGMMRDLSKDGVRMVLSHEIAHLRRRDQYRALAWRVFFALLILPGFGAVEQLLNRRREAAADRKLMAENHRVYSDLLRRNSSRHDGLYGSICTPGVEIPGLSGLNASPQYLADRIQPAAIAISVLALVLFSQMLFLSTLPYLKSHHC